MTIEVKPFENSKVCVEVLQQAIGTGNALDVVAVISLITAAQGTPQTVELINQAIGADEIALLQAAREAAVREKVNRPLEEWVIRLTSHEN